MKTVISYGAGTNSTAMLIGLYERGERPDIILFADTGAERDETYKHRDLVSDWCESIGFPRIDTVKNDSPSRMGGLEQFSLHHKALPSIAYGFKSCSQIFKAEPQDKFLKNHPLMIEEWSKGNTVIKMQGYDADEQHRANKVPPPEVMKKYTMRYPLIEWGWGREECVEAIERAGMPQVGKSACFFCPSSKKKEIIQLRKDYPELAKRAVEMELNANLTSIKGLGRNFAWGDLYKAIDDQRDWVDESRIEIDCGCYDG